MITNKRGKKSGKIPQSAGEDRRIRRTKKLLKEAMLELILEFDYDQISVQQIIDRADVGRTSFYTHFKSKEDLLLQNLDDLETIFTPEKTTGPDEPTLGKFALLMFEHLYENWDLGKILLGNKRIPIVREHLQEILRKSIRSLLNKVEKKTNTPLDAESTAVFYSGGLVSLILWWLSMKNPPTPGKIHTLFLERCKVD